MRRPWWTRLTAAVLGLWLVLVLGEPGVVHVCPTHGGGFARAASMRRAGHGHDMSGMPVVATAQRGDRDQAPSHDHHGCTCIGCCVGASAVALVDRVPTSEFAVPLVPTTAARATVDLLPRPGPRNSRPYTTGPPRV